MSVGVLVLLACIGTWIVFHFLHKRQLDRIPLLEERIKAKDEKIAELEKRSSSISPPSSVHTQDQLIIHSAMYGLGPGSELDVLGQVRTIVERGERQIRVHPDTFGIPDPYPGKEKRLVIMFSIGNRKNQSATGKDYGYVNLPS